MSGFKLTLSSYKFQNQYRGFFQGRNLATISKLQEITSTVREFIEQYVELCKPENLHICDGSETENKFILSKLQEQGTIVPLPKYENCWLARTDPADTARVESKTFLCSERKSDSIPTPKNGVPGVLGNWMSLEEMDRIVKDRFRGIMKNRTMYVIPFLMGPFGSQLSKVGIELTDSPYVVSSMRIMTRMGKSVLDILKNEPGFVKCLHSVGMPENTSHYSSHWPCDPERTIILHKPTTNEIFSYGSGYGGNSLLGKKCFSLRIGSFIARSEGWLAEHMLILGITNPKGKKRYIAAAFPSACGKTNLAMMSPSLPGYKIECVGDDIAWMRFDENGQLRAINPENGFFGVAPGTSKSSNPVAMKTIFKNSIFTNVASTSDGGIFWEGLEKEIDPSVHITDWLGKPWKQGRKTLAAHPNSRFCCPASQCPIIDPQWESPNGVPISAIIFGGRRPEGIPLVYEARNWKNGVLIGASMRSESTAAAEFKNKSIMHDPFAMRPFFGYNFGKYLEHWLSMEKPNRTMPKIFHVNWFRKDKNGNFLWPGFGENSRVLDWVLRRVDGENCAHETAIGFIPIKKTLQLDGINKAIDVDELFHLSKDFWSKEICDIQRYLEEQVNEDLPEEIKKELEILQSRIQKIDC